MIISGANARPYFQQCKSLNKLPYGEWITYHITGKWTHLEKPHHSCNMLDYIFFVMKTLLIEVNLTYTVLKIFVTSNILCWIISSFDKHFVKRPYFVICSSASQLDISTHSQLLRLAVLLWAVTHVYNVLISRIMWVY